MARGDSLWLASLVSPRWRRVVAQLRAVRALERRGIASTELTALRDRLQMLEDQVTEQGEAVRRLTDGQEFTQRLLLERARSEPIEKGTPAT